jgi:signal peptidase II
MLPFFSLRRDKRAPILLFSVALVVLAADQLSKEWVRHSLSVGESIPEHGVLRLVNSTNSGIIFGLEAPLAVSIAVPILLVCAALLAYYWYGPIADRRANVCLGLFVGGSAGNLLDRLRFGAVTDYIDVRLWREVHWFTFNLADAAIVVAIILFAVLISGVRLRRGPKSQ